MADLRPFQALRPPRDLVARVSAPPYDVLDVDEARTLAAGNPDSFLHISRPEIDLPDDVGPYDARVYQQGRRALADFITRGVLVRDTTPGYLIYRQRWHGRQQTGIVGCAAVADYETGVIRTHEHTRPDKERDRVRHIDALAAHDEPVFLLAPRSDAVESVVEQVVSGPPSYDFTSDDEVTHTLWAVHDPRLVSALRSGFAGIARVYVADGHHRSAAAVAVHQARARRRSRVMGDTGPTAPADAGFGDGVPGNGAPGNGAPGNGAPGNGVAGDAVARHPARSGSGDVELRASRAVATPVAELPVADLQVAAVQGTAVQGTDAEDAAFLAVVFPADELQILAYNRVVTDLADRTPQELLDALGESFEVTPTGSAPVNPDRRHDIGMYLAGSSIASDGGQWFRLRARPGLVDETDPIGRLDVTLLQDRVLAPLLGIGDPRTDARIRFVGGIRGTEELVRLVDRNSAGGGSAGNGSAGSDVAAVAFALYPTSVAELLAVADAGTVMPPKSTWFEPKLRSGLFVHTLDSSSAPGGDT